MIKFKLKELLRLNNMLIVNVELKEILTSFDMLSVKEINLKFYDIDIDRVSRSEYVEEVISRG